MRRSNLEVFIRHSRESGNPCIIKLDSRFRGDDVFAWIASASPRNDNLKYGN